MQIIGQIIIPNVYSLYPDTMQIYYKQSIRSMDFDNRKVYGDTSITDGLVYPLHHIEQGWSENPLGTVKLATDE